MKIQSNLKFPVIADHNYMSDINNLVKFSFEDFLNLLCF